MSNDGFEERKRSISYAWEDYATFYPVALVVLLVGILIGFGLSSVTDFGFDDIYAELISVIVTVGIVEVLLRWREKREQNKVQRVLNMNYGVFYDDPEPHHRFAEMVIRDLLFGYVVEGFDISGFKGRDMTIRKTQLVNFNMRGSQWHKTDFSRTKLIFCDLRESSFEHGCVLQDVCIQGCKLEQAHINKCSFENSTIEGCYLNQGRLFHTNFMNVIFKNSSLRECRRIRDCDFRGADFTGCDVKSSSIAHKTNEFDHNTILPDGTHYDPSKGLEQWRQFTDSSHPEFDRNITGRD